ncbi:MAG: hypothetical protein K2X54_15710, partial [Methylobacterium organophilum]|nr:hypothetical protein [Methylobacterium organophilum]
RFRVADEPAKWSAGQLAGRPETPVDRWQATGGESLVDLVEAGTAGEVEICGAGRIRSTRRMAGEVDDVMLSDDEVALRSSVPPPEQERDRA